MDGSSVKVSWSLPSDNGSPITAYKIYLKEKVSESYTQESVDCDGNDATVISNRFCYVSTNTIASSPYDLIGGDSVWAKVIAVNVYGETA
jgi:hypothetical protein